MRKIYFITSNLSKVSEVQVLLGKEFNIEALSIDLPEIQSTNVKEIIIHKLEKAYEIMENNGDIEVMCEDTGSHFKNMNNFPGALIKFYFEHVKLDGIVKFNGGSKAKTVTIVGLKNKNGTFFFKGTTKGKIIKKLVEINKESFGWDPTFIPKYPKEYEMYKGKTYADIPKEVKNMISQRSKAIGKMIQSLSDN